MTRLQVGETKGQWKVLEVLPSVPREKKFVMAQCACGTKRKVREDHIRLGISRSCGHALKEKHRKVMGSILEHDKKDPQRLTA